MSRWYLGIDTSNYRTSVGLFEAQEKKWQLFGRLLDVPQGKIGLRQSDALFQHTLHLHEMIAQLPAGIGRQVQAVCVSTQPRAIEGSYMPCFLAGENVARSIAHVLGVPIYTCSHQQGHLAAAALSANVLDWLLQEKLYAWHLSGGTTELLSVCPDEKKMPQAVCIGGTNDLTAGQLVDRTGALLGLAFPAGQALEELAAQAEETTCFQPKVKDCIFSLSGVQNKVQQLVLQSCPSSQIAAFTIQTIGAAVCRATVQALKQEKRKILCAGGVMSNHWIQQQMHSQFGARFAQPQLSGDNAVGTAVLAAVQHGELFV